MENGAKRILILNGGHRIRAYEEFNKNNDEKIKKIKAKFWKSKEPIDFEENMNEMLIHSHQVNDEQGLNVRPMDTRHTARILRRRNPEMTGKEIGEELGRKQGTIAPYIKDIVQEQKASEQHLIVNLRLMGWNFREISEHPEITVGQDMCRKNHNNIDANKIIDLHNNKGKSPEQLSEIFDISVPSIWHYLLEDKNDREKMEEFGCKIETFSHWSIGKRDERLGQEHKGNIPGQIPLNVIYKYSEQSDLVVDPMAGGGPTLDACLIMDRECRAYDVNPERDDIMKHDITDGYPDIKKADLIFLDPFYFKKVSERLKTREEFFDFIRSIAEYCDQGLKDDGVISLLQSNYCFYDEPEKSIFTYQSVDKFEDLGFTPIKEVQCPLSTEQHDPWEVENAKDKREWLELSRSLWIFKRI